jgi:hypothetical protein
MSIARFEISEMPLPPPRYWPTAGAQKGIQRGNLTVGAGANLFSHSLGRKRTSTIPFICLFADTMLSEVMPIALHRPS